MKSDGELLRRYTESNSEDAFAELVRRHLDLVYSTALRRVNGDAHLAQDVTQLVFADLARKAVSLVDRQALAGWLYTGAHYGAANAVRTEQRRRTREQEAHAMHELLHDPGPNPDWETLRPVLDTAMHELDEADREVILLRYFENRPHADIGEQFGVSENTARMRIERALEKLRVLLSHRGVTTTAAALSIVISANAIQAAPVGLAVSISTTAAVGGTPLAASATATATKAIAMTTFQKTIVAATITVAVGVGTTVTVKEVHAHKLSTTIQSGGIVPVRGVVIGDQGKPAEGAIVCIPPSTNKKALSDEQGRFEFGLETKWALEAEVDKQSAIKEGQFKRSYVFVRDPPHRQAGIIELGKVTEKKTIRLAPAPTITGRLVDERGAGIKDATVYFSLSPRDTGWRAYFAEDSVLTDIEGKYEMLAMPFLPGGAYTLHVKGETARGRVGITLFMADDGTEQVEVMDEKSESRRSIRKAESGRLQIDDIVFAHGELRIR